MTHQAPARLWPPNRGKQLIRSASPSDPIPGVRAWSADDVEDVLLQAVGVDVVFYQLQFLGVLVRGAEQALARTEQQRVDEQVVAVDQARVRRLWFREALPWTMIGPPSVSFRAATWSSERRIVVSPQFETRSSSVSVVETTYFGIVL